MNSKDLEKKLWASAKKVSNKSNSLAAVHLVLGLVFLRNITDLSTNVEDPKNNQNNILNRTGEDDQDHVAYNEYFVPQQAQWNFLQSHVGQTGIGQLIDDAIQSLEKLNDNLKGIFDLKYADPGL